MFTGTGGGGAGTSSGSFAGTEAGRAWRGVTELSLTSREVSLLELLLRRRGEVVSKREILAHVKQRLGIDVGETTDDDRITLQSVECLCACEVAPMMQVDDRYEVSLTPEKVDRILEALR